MQNSAFLQAENFRFHDPAHWRVDRTTPFTQLVYRDSVGTDQYYRPNEAPADVSAALLSRNNADEIETNPLDECLEIPLQVYELLPSQYRTLCALYDTVHERHAFLCGLLPTVASLLPNVRGAHADGLYSPDLFFALVASAGQGKSAASRAFALAFPVDEMLRCQSERARAEHEEQDAAGEPPAEKTHIVPANASAIALIQSLYDNDGRALVAETEIDSMLAADRNLEWGNISSILRAAFHHESISVKRKSAYRGKTALSIKEPCLSVFLSGTPSQFRELMRSTENGLFSRFAVYYHNPPITWRSHRPTANSVRRSSVIQTEGEILKTVFQLLTSRAAPLLVELTGEQWDTIDGAFSAMQDVFFHEEQRADLLPSARRGAIVAFRLALQFAVIRWIEINGLQAFAELCKQENATIQANDADVECAVLLAKIFTSHAHKLSSLLPQTTNAVSSPKTSVSRFLDALPEDFETREAVTIGAKTGIARRTVERYLKNLTDSGALRKMANGRYAKTDGGEIVATIGTAAPTITATPTIPAIGRVTTNTTRARRGGTVADILGDETPEEFVRRMVREQRERAERAARAERAKNFDFGAESPPDYDNSIYEF
jgi:hypothetical protein